MNATSPRAGEASPYCDSHHPVSHAYLCMVPRGHQGPHANYNLPPGQQEWTGTSSEQLDRIEAMLHEVLACQVACCNAKAKAT
jgi:hypothetical protein